MLIVEGITFSWPQVVTLLVGSTAVQTLIIKSVFDKSVIAALRRSKPELKNIIDELYASQLKTIDAMEEKIGLNENRLTFIDGQLIQQNTMIKEQINNNHREINIALNALTETLKEIKKDFKEASTIFTESNKNTSIAIARLELAAEIKPWKKAD